MAAQWRTGKHSFHDYSNNRTPFRLHVSAQSNTKRVRMRPHRRILKHAFEKHSKNSRDETASRFQFSNERVYRLVEKAVLDADKFDKHKRHDRVYLFKEYDFDIGFSPVYGVCRSMKIVYDLETHQVITAYPDKVSMGYFWIHCWWYVVMMVCCKTGYKIVLLSLFQSILTYS